MIVKLKDVAKLQGGYAFKSTDFVKGGIPIVRIGNIVENKIFIDDKITINDYEFKKVHPEFVINKGDILVAMSGATVGKIGVYELEEESLLNQRVGKFVTTDKVNGKYLYYILRSKLFNKYILENAFGCAQPNISGKQIEEFEFKLYEKEQQKQIIEILDRVQESIDIRKKQIESLDSLIKARFVELFGSIKETTKLASCCDRITDYVASGSFASIRENVRSYADEEYAIMVKTADFANGFTKNLTYTDKHGYDFLHNSNLFGGELLLSNIGASIGKVHRVPNLNRPMTLAPNAIMIKGNKYFLDDYLQYFFLSYLGQRQLKEMTTATAMPKFNKTQLKEVIVPVAPIDLQNQFSTFVEQTDKSKLELQKSLEAIQNLFDSLMAEYFG